MGLIFSVGRELPCWSAGSAWRPPSCCRKPSSVSRRRTSRQNPWQCIQNSLVETVISQAGHDPAGVRAVHGGRQADLAAERSHKLLEPKFDSWQPSFAGWAPSCWSAGSTWRRENRHLQLSIMKACPTNWNSPTAFTCRLGTILLEQGQYMEAAELVSKAAERFTEALKPDNPVRGEAAFALALARMFQLMPFQVRSIRVRNRCIAMSENSIQRCMAWQPLRWRWRGMFQLMPFQVRIAVSPDWCTLDVTQSRPRFGTGRALDVARVGLYSS